MPTDFVFFNFPTSSHFRYTRMEMRRWIVVLSLALFGCNEPADVSSFCGSAQTVLAASTLVLNDMKASCFRAIDLRSPLGSFAAPAQSDPGCDQIAAQGAGAVAAAKILGEYFAAVNSLASFGTARAGTDASNLVNQTGTALGAASIAQTAIGSMTQFLVQTATSGYQRKSLAQDLPKVSANVSAVANGLAAIIQNEYIDQLLSDEEKKLANRYREFIINSTNDHTLTPELKVSLENAWRTEEAALTSRRASAHVLVQALGLVSKGFADLAANATHFSGAELAGLLQPWIAQIQSLVPMIQKGS
jgi:hypothetical protein